MMSQVLMVFVRNPVAGKVKTRLARDVGDEKALRIYQKLLTYTREIIRSVPVQKQIWYSDNIPENNRWRGQHVDYKVQVGADLGERMKHAFSDAFGQGYDRAVIIGSDCAELTSAHLRETYRRLQNTDLVIGPSEDGGYYLLGMNEFHPRLFDDIDWSTDRVFSQTLDRVNSLGLEYHLLEELNDVDYQEDWNSVKNKL